MKIERIDTTAWEKNVLGHAKENVFVQPWLLQVTDEIFGLETMYLALYPENEHSVHYVVLQKKEHSAWAPFLGYGEIVADGILSEREVYLDIKAMEKDCNIEIQRIKFSPHIVLHDTCLLRKEQASILSLGGRPNQYIENFSKTVRTGIRYAQKHGIQIRLLTKRFFGFLLVECVFGSGENASGKLFAYGCITTRISNARSSLDRYGEFAYALNQANKKTMGSGGHPIL